MPTPRTRHRLWLHVLLFLVTAAVCTYIGRDHWLGFKMDYGYVPLRAVLRGLTPTTLMLRGLWYMLTILAILGCHEMGHYFACRYYRINASLPYFIPAPPPFITGTFGAFIKIRQPFPSRRALFDVGIAGPIAGFVVAVPALFIGVALSHVTRVPLRFVGEELGEPIILKLAARLFWGTIPDGYSLNLHPMAFAAWFGILATVLNLLPIGQLDGGHIAYTVLGRRSSQLTRVMLVGVFGMVFVAWSWLFWGVLLLLMLGTFGVAHPPTLDDSLPLGTGRKILVGVAIAIFILCFMAVPIRPLDLVR
jgi:membrane-associated protease RseP (regulator of RpoE activity)